MWETWEVELEEVIDAGGDRAIAFIRERGRTKAGFDINERHSELYVTKDGKDRLSKRFLGCGRGSCRSWPPLAASRESNATPAVHGKQPWRGRTKYAAVNVARRLRSGS
jgi:hypothetical protein